MIEFARQIRSGGDPVRPETSGYPGVVPVLEVRKGSRVPGGLGHV